MKAGWEVKTLDCIAEVKGGKRVPKGYQLQLKPTNHPYITVSDFSDDGTVDSSSLRYVNSEVFEQIKRYTISSKDLYLSIAGTIGKTGRVPPELDGASLTENACKLVLRPGIHRDFVYYFTKSDDFARQAGTNTRTAAQPKLALERLKTIKLSIPTSFPEQQRIVTLLDEAFDGIATARAHAEKNLQNARAIFESHLQSVFTQRGDGWEDKTLEQISTTFGRGKSRHRPRNEPKLYGGKYPFIQTGDIRNAGHFITEYSQTYSELGLSQSKLWPKGTICITIAANIAETGILGFDACFPDSVIGIVPNPAEAEVGFVEYLLQSFKVRIQALGQGSAQANINMGTFENERFPFPSVAEQRRIVAKLDDLSEEIQRLESIYQQKLTALDELKKSLLHRAFNGAL
jgi:type I restriction enzyme S subunit